jgi:hypothetical protein
MTETPASRLSADVTDWFVAYDIPHQDLMLKIRSFILAVDARIGECVKWKTPTFTYKGNIASSNPRAKKHVSLMFHTGAKLPGAHPRLHATGDTAAYMTFTDPDDFAAQRNDLADALRAWITVKDTPPA